MSRTPAEKLIKEGWQKQTTYDDPRLSEMAEMYQKIGLEIHLEPFNVENESGCTACVQVSPGLFKTIYTRGKAGQGMTSDE